MSSGSQTKPQISLADLEKKAAESNAKAHKWEIEELQNIIMGLHDELSEPRFRPRKTLMMFILASRESKG